MQSNQTLDVRWRKVTRHTYKHGATIQFHDDYTYYENQLMPSGLQINLWEPATTFDKDGHPPKLPMLKRGYRYDIHLDITAMPAQSVYVIVTFYLKNGKAFDHCMIKETDSYFIYPNEAYSYDICLMNAACHHLIFKKITLTERYFVKDKDKEIAESIESSTNDILTSSDDITETHSSEDGRPRTPQENVNLVNQIMKTTRPKHDHN